MARLAKKTDNEIVAEWLIEHRWKETLNSDTKQKMPAFVEEAVWAAVYIVAGTHNGKVNISPKLVFKCLMLDPITSESVKTREVGYAMGDSTARRLAQTARFALKGIQGRIEAYQQQIPEEVLRVKEMERKFVIAYYTGFDSPLYSEPLPPIPSEIMQLRSEGKYLEYGEAVREFRSK
jgi:hypothetical protein